MTGVKRILCVMLAALLVICMIPATAFAGMNEYCPECHESYTHAYCVECRKCNFCIELCDVCEELCEECCDCAGVTITGTIFGHFANKEAIVKLVPESDMPEQICTVKVGTDSYSFTKIPAGKYTIMVIQSDIKIAERSITVSSKNVTLNFSCTRPPCPSCGKVPVGVVCSGCMDCSDCAVLCPSHALCNSCSVYLGVHCASCTKCGNESEICADCGFCSECAVLKGKHCPECREHYTHAYCVECKKCNSCVELCEVCEELCEECCVCIKVTIKGTIAGHDVSKDVIIRLEAKAGTPAQSVTVKAGTDSYSFTEIPSGEYTITVIQSDVTLAQRTVTVGEKDITLDFECTPRPVCPSCMKEPEGELCADCGYCSECAVLKGKHCPECREHYTHAYCVECKKCNSCVELCEVCEELCEECCVCIKVTIKGTIAGHDVSKDVIIRLEAKAGTPAQSVTVKAGTDSYSFTEIPSGEYTITVIQSDVTLAQRTVTVGEKDITLDFECTPRPVCPSCMKEPEGELCADCGYCSECAVLKGKHCPECREHHTHAYCVECKKCNSCVELCEVCEELCEDCCVCDTGVYVKGVLKGSDPAKEHKIFMYPDDPNKDTRQYELLEGRYVFQFVGVHSGGYTIEVHQGGEKIAEVHIQVGIKNVEVEIVMSETEEYLLGDVNGDGKINALDATQILRYANNKSSVIAAMSDAEAKGKADVNKDGKINALDATQILRYANNKSSILK